MQIVLCPGYNDGLELERTLKDLSTLGEELLSVAIVPVGVTQFREQELKTVDKNIAKETLAIAKKYAKVCCSDEFFLLAEEEIPNSNYYGNFSQLDDGVGSLRALLDDFAEQDLPEALSKPLNICFACSVAAETAFIEIAKRLNSIKNLNVQVKPVKSTYWGKNITVAGLITSEDLINTVIDVQADYIVVPKIMLKPFSDLFLDGVSMQSVIDKTNKNFFISEDNYSIAEVIDLIYQFE